jgi:hypothetical protein
MLKAMASGKSDDPDREARHQILPEGAETVFRVVLGGENLKHFSG